MYMSSSHFAGVTELHLGRVLWDDWQAEAKSRLLLLCTLLIQQVDGEKPGEPVILFLVTARPGDSTINLPEQSASPFQFQPRLRSTSGS